MNDSTEETGSDLDIINLKSIEAYLGNEQTWLLSSENSANSDVDVRNWILESTDVSKFNIEHRKNVAEMIAVLDHLDSGINKQRFDSRTYTRPKKKTVRPSLYSVVPNHSYTSNHYNTENLCGKSVGIHTRPHGDYLGITSKYTNEDISGTTDGLEDAEYALTNVSSKPININLSEPAHNLHNTFNKFNNTASNKNNSITNMSPPSLVSSIAMEDSGAFNSSNFSRKSSTSSKNSTSDNEEIYMENKNNDKLSYNNMDMSILDENEMNTSILSHFQDDSLTISPLQSIEPNLTLSINRTIMESSLVNSGTFNTVLEPIDDKLPNGQPKFQLRKSFLKPDPEDNFDKFLALNANFNTEDLRGISNDLRYKSKYDTYKKSSEKENLNISHLQDESFLVGDGMSDSFLRETGRESINITYNKMPTTPQRVRTVNRPQIDVEHTIILPNQALSPHQFSANAGINTTYSKRINRTFDAAAREKEIPKRDISMKKISLSPKNATENVAFSENGDKNKFETFVEDSNKQSYNNLDKEEIVSKREEIFEEKENDVELLNKPLEGKNSEDSRSTSPHHIVPLNMDDLEHLAYEQEQKLYQVVSTPISKLTSQTSNSTDNLFKQNVISPIHGKQADIMTLSSSSNISDSSDKNQHIRNVSSLGSLYKMNSSPKKSPIKRESSETEIKSGTSSYRMPFTQKLGINPSARQRGGPQMHSYQNTEEGLYTSRSAGGSPARHVMRTSGLSRPLNAAPVSLTGSDNQLGLKKSGLPSSKLRQYSSHKELNKIIGPSHSSAAGSMNTLRSSSKLSFYASNPVLCPKPLVRQASYTIVSKDGSNVNIHQDAEKSSAPDLRMPSKCPSGVQTTVGSVSYGQPLKAKHSIGISIPNYNRPLPIPRTESVPVIASKPVPSTQNKLKMVPNNNINSQRIPKPSGLPRPSSGNVRKSSIRPPSTYSLAPRPNDQTDCY